MRESIRKFVELAVETLTLPEPIYEFGAYQVPGQEAMADLRSLFPGMEYVGSDMRPGKGVDVILDLHDLDLPDSSVGTAISLDTMEHVEYPHRACQELHRVLKDDGVLIMTSVMKFPIHEHPHDYWRFTPEAFKSLLRPFAFSFVGYAGEDDFPHTVLGIASKSTIAAGQFEVFRSEYEAWKQWARLGSWREWSPDSPPEELLPADTGLRRLLRRSTPPAVLDLAKKVLRR